MSLAEAAQAWGVSYSAIKWRRARAERALVRSHLG
jgi:DNA-directed RNA polymerase specialized sigma24 family protein